jgi:hypothetical protein
VRKVALSLPDTEERPSYGTPGFRAKGTLFARVLDSRTIVVRVDLAWRDALVDAAPEIFSVTPHYVGYPWVVVSLATLDRARLREILGEAHALVKTRTSKAGAARGRARR